MAPDGTVIADRPPIDPDNPTEEELRILSYPSVLLSFEPGGEHDAETRTHPQKNAGPGLPSMKGVDSES